MDGAAVLLDLDGTLVDSAYLHVLAWQRAFREHGVEVEAARIHRCIGMGGAELVPALVGPAQDAAIGDAVRDAWRRGFDALLPDVRPLPDARRLVDALRSGGARVALASSAPAAHLEAYLGLLGLADAGLAATTADDVEAAKPAPDIVGRALAAVGGPPGVLVGDAPYDCLAAGRAGLACVGVTLGGYAAEELLAAGAARVVDRLAALADGEVDLAAIATAGAV